MHKTVSAISTSRAQRSNIGFIYAVRYYELDFTVPEFSGFLRRLPEFGEWEKENQEEQKKDSGASARLEKGRASTIWKHQKVNQVADYLGRHPETSES